MSDDFDKVTRDELEAVEGEELPERSVMSVISGGKLIVPVGPVPEPIMTPPGVIEPPQPLG